MNKFERIEQVRLKLDISREDFIKVLGLSAVSNYSTFIRSGANTAMRDDKLEALLFNYKVNLIWIYTGEGNMFLTEGDNTASEVLKQADKYLDFMTSKQYGEIDIRISTLNKEVEDLKKAVSAISKMSDS